MILRLLFSLCFTTASNITVNRIPSTGTPPPRRLYAVSVYFQGNIYFFGGMNTSGESINEFHAFQVQTEVWKRLEPVDDISPMGRVVFAMYASNEAIFVHGGHGPNGILNDLWSYDVTVNIWSRITQNGDVPPPFYRPGYTVFTHDDIQYFGLSCFATENLLASNDLYLYNTTTKTWRKMPNVAKTDHTVPPPRRLCNLNYYNGYIYLWGGNLWEENAGAQLYRYDLTSEEWESIPASGILPWTRMHFKSFVYNHSLYIFCGWVEPLYQPVDETWRLDLRQVEQQGNAVWEELQIQQIADYNSYLPRDSYAATLIDNHFYIHGGYSHLVPLGNFLIKLDIDTSPIGLTVLGNNIDIPSNRYFSTLTLISAKFYMYGGSTGSRVLDELWMYNENEETWQLQDTIGNGPGARQGHAAAAIGDTLMIWGGKNGSKFYSDIHMYNTLTNIWEEVDIKSIINPTGVEGACMEVYNDDMYIFGGKNEFRSNKYLWKFNLGSNEYTLLSTLNYNSPTEVSYSTCYAIGHNLYIMYGVLDDTTSPRAIHIFDLETHQWTISEMIISSEVGHVASGKVDKSIIIANGSRWGNWAFNDVWVLNMESNSIEHMIDLDWNTFAESSVYHKNSLYVFGGGDSLADGVIRKTRSVDRFYKVKFPDMPCSQGSYLFNNECISCPKGTYKDTYGPDSCIQCSIGTYNEHIGASTVKQCIPCPEGMFNPYLGQNYCLKCPGYDICPAGSAAPRAKTIHDHEYSDKQPETHESSEHLANRYSLYTLFYMFLAFILMLFVILFSPTLRNNIPILDMFMSEHNHEPNKNMTTRKTLIGGISTIIVYALILFLTIQALLYYFYDNIEEIKSLIPLVVVNEFSDTIKGTINIKVTFNEYGGEWTTTENQCMPEIQYTKTNIKGYFSELSCSLAGNACLIDLTCDHCILDPSAQILFSSYENSSHATSIKVEVSSQSSVPDFDSYIKYRQSVESGEVFRGAEPTVFHFQAIPSVFESDILNEVSHETGYHLALGDLSQLGSYYTVQNLSKTRYLHTQILFTQIQSALQTQRNYKIRNDVLIISIIGGIAGVIEIVALFMQMIEKVYETFENKWKNKERRHKTYKRDKTLSFHVARDQEEPKTSYENLEEFQEIVPNSSNNFSDDDFDVSSSGLNFQEIKNITKRPAIPTIMPTSSNESLLNKEINTFPRVKSQKSKVSSNNISRLELSKFVQKSRVSEDIHTNIISPASPIHQSVDVSDTRSDLSHVLRFKDNNF